MFNFDGFKSDLAEIPQFKRGMVWCTECGRSQRVDAVAATMGRGWPMCCGYTMTIDSPEERAALRKETPTPPNRRMTDDIS